MAPTTSPPTSPPGQLPRTRFHRPPRQLLAGRRRHARLDILSRQQRREHHHCLQRNPVRHGHGCCRSCTAADCCCAATNAADATTGLIVGPMGVQVGGGASGGDKGIGTLNVQVAIYDGGVLITCLPLQNEFLRQGHDRPEEVGRACRQWQAARGSASFRRSAQAGRRPARPDAVHRGDEERCRRCPGMPTMEDWEHNELSIGEMFNRLWLAVEMFAVAWMSHVGSERETRALKKIRIRQQRDPPAVTRHRRSPSCGWSPATARTSLLRGRDQAARAYHRRHRRHQGREQ